MVKDEVLFEIKNSNNTTTKVVGIVVSVFEDALFVLVGHDMVYGIHPDICSRTS
jgi:hypothetical protein